MLYTLYKYKSSVRVVFNEIVQTNKDYMRDVTVIDPEWLHELAGHFYHFAALEY